MQLGVEIAILAIAGAGIVRACWNLQQNKSVKKQQELKRLA